MKKDIFQTVRMLQNSAREIRSLAYLISLQKLDQAPPLDVEQKAGAIRSF